MLCKAVAAMRNGIKNSIQVEEAVIKWGGNDQRQTVPMVKQVRTMERFHFDEKGKQSAIKQWSGFSIPHGRSPIRPTPKNHSSDINLKKLRIHARF